MMDSPMRISKKYGPINQQKMTSILTKMNIDGLQNKTMKGGRCAISISPYFLLANRASANSKSSGVVILIFS